MSKNEWKEILKAELFLPDKLNIVDFNSDCCKNAAMHMKNLNAEFDIRFRNAADGRGWIKSKGHLQRLDEMNRDYCDELYKSIERESILNIYDKEYLKKNLMLWDNCDKKARRLFGNYTDEQRGWKPAGMRLRGRSGERLLE